MIPTASRATGRRTAAVLTLGCKLNQAESEAIARELALAGWHVVDRPAAADAFVINSCSVTHVADKKSRHLVRLARRLAPEATVLLTGCYPETAETEIALATGADLVVPSRDKAAVVARLLAYRAQGARHAAEEDIDAAGGEGRAVQPGRTIEAMPAGTSGTALAAGMLRTRAFVKAQEGCNDVCAFCIVPRTRGRERSIAPEAVAAVVAERERDGAQEVVITGTQLGAYGRDLDPAHYGPAAVIRAVLAETAVPRIRFSSLQPQDITPALLALWEDPRLCRHFHLALQSGSEGVLRRMRRRYTIAQYREALAMIREAVPEAAVTTDVIVGFPGETEAEAAESLAFCRQAGFALMHVFPYSRRPGTTAHLLKEHLPEPVKRVRLEEMLAVARGSAAAFRRRFLGRTLPVLWEARVRDTGTLSGAAAGAPPTTERSAGGPGPCNDAMLPVWEGLTDNYVRVYARTAAPLHNRIIPVQLIDEAGDGLWGEPACAAPAEAGRVDATSGAGSFTYDRRPGVEDGDGAAARRSVPAFIPLSAVERR